MKKKIIIKAGFAAIAFAAIASVSSCSVAYRTRHPRYEERREGFVKPALPLNTAVAASTHSVPVNNVLVITGTR